MLWCCVWQEGRRYQGSFLLEFAYVTLGQLGLSSFVCFFVFPLLLDLFFLVPEINIREKVEIGEEKTIDPPNFKRRMPRKRVYLTEADVGELWEVVARAMHLPAPAFLYKNKQTNKQTN